jgi:hypothetical protein
MARCSPSYRPNPVFSGEYVEPPTTAIQPPIKVSKYFTVVMTSTKNMLEKQGHANSGAYIAIFWKLSLNISQSHTT